MKKSSALGRLRRRLSFANVVSLLALFVALGGSSYAAVRVGSGDIVDNSVRSKDLRNDDVRGKDIRNGTVRSRDLRNNSILSRDVHENSLLTGDIRDGNVFSGDIHDGSVTGKDVNESSLGTVPNASTLDGKDSSAFLAGRKTGLVKLSYGQTKVVARSGPYTWSAGCSDTGGGNTRLVVSVRSSVGGATAASFGQSVPIPAGGSATVFDSNSGSPEYSIAFPFGAVAPTGSAPQGIAFAGLNVAGDKCVVNGFVIQ